MIANENRILALREIGYTAREAEFLCLAAVFSGFFLRRQYCQLINRGSGYPVDQLAKKLISRGHAREIHTARRTLLYHLCSRPFYAAIGEEDNRHRRTRPWFAIKSKLMALDYVLLYPGNYLSTEAEKINYFCHERGIAIDILPSKAYSSSGKELRVQRYFADKFPISISDDHQVSFSYIDEGMIATPSFETYLTQYSPLFSALGQCQIAYVSSRENRIDAAEATFQRVTGNEIIENHSGERLESFYSHAFEELKNHENRSQESNFFTLIDALNPAEASTNINDLSRNFPIKTRPNVKFEGFYLPFDYGFLDTA